MLQLYCERMHSNEPVHTWDERAVTNRDSGGGSFSDRCAGRCALVRVVR